MRRLLLVMLLPVFSSAQVAHVAGALSFGQQTGSVVNGAWTSGSHTPNATNHAVAIFASCAATSLPSACSITASAAGYTFTAMSGVTGSTTAGFACTWAAITPNTTATTFTPTFTGGGTCQNFANILMDEFSGNNTTGGTTTFYAHNQNTATTGGCSGAASTSNSANDAVWGACNDGLAASAWQGAGWTIGVSDGGAAGANDGTEFKVGSGSQTPAWASTSGSFVQATIAIAAVPAATVVGNTIAGPNKWGGSSVIK